MSSPRFNTGDAVTRTITKSDGTVLVRIGSKEDRQSNTIPQISETSSTIERRTVTSNEDLEDTRRRQLAKNAAYRQSSTRQYIEDDNNNNISNMDTGHMIYTTVSSKQKQERPRSPNSTTQSFITRKITKGRISSKSNTSADQSILSKAEPYEKHMNGDTKTNEDHLEWIARKKLNYQEDGSVKDLPKDACFWCKKTVYQKEKVGPIRDVLYHKQCFRCSVCGFVLNLQNFHQNSNDLEDKSLYCKSHEPETEASRISIKDQRIQAVLNKPKVEQLNPNIRGGHDTSKARPVGMESASIKNKVIAPKLNRFNPNVRVSQDTQRDQYVVDDTIYVRAATSQSTEPVGSYGHGTVSIQVQNENIPVQNGNTMDYYALGMKTAVNVPKVSVYNSTVRPVPEMVKTAPEVYIRPTEYRTRQIMDPQFTKTPTPPSSPQHVSFNGNTKTYYYINGK